MHEQPHQASREARSTKSASPPRGAAGQIEAGEGQTKRRGPEGEAPVALRCLVLTSSDSRTVQTDHGGAYAARALRDAGHDVLDRRVVADDVTAIRAVVLEAVELGGLDLLLTIGGTALGVRDVTPEAVLPLFRKSLPGFGEALRRLAWEAEGPHALLTRAAGGVVARTLVLLLPGAPEVVRLAMDQLVVPVVREACSQLRG